MIANLTLPAVPVDTATLATMLLAPIRALAEQAGMKQRIADMLSTLTGQTYTRQMVDRWLREANPVEPRLGVAILLFKIANEIDPQAVPLEGGPKKSPAQKRKTKTGRKARK